MKRIFPNTIVSSVLCLLTVALPVAAQTFSVLHTFGRGAFQGGILGPFTNADGINPNGWLTLAGTNLYGTAVLGGANGAGSMFSTSTNGVFKLLYSFPAETVGTGNTFGASPNGGLVYSNGLLYGTASGGGGSDEGVIFSISTNGSGISVLYNFSGLVNSNSLGLMTNSDGGDPAAGLIQSGTVLFGTGLDGGTNGNGVVFAYNYSVLSKTYTVLHHFNLGNLQTNIDYVNQITNTVLTNSDGANPSCSLVLSGITLYGTTSAGGTNGNGTVFAVNTNGTGFSVLHYFDTNGASPKAGLVVSGNTLFGIGGSYIYALNTNGSGFTVLRRFNTGVDGDTYGLNSGLTLSNAIMYGSVFNGGANGSGQVASLDTNGLGWVDFYDFSLPVFYPAPPTNADGMNPGGGLVIVNNALYGAASAGGFYGSGTLFKTAPPPPPLSSKLSGRNFTLSFQAFAGMNYTVQQNTNLSKTNWINFTNVAGGGVVTQFTVLATNKVPVLFFRVQQQ